MIERFRRKWWLGPIVFAAVLLFIGWFLDWPLITAYREHLCRERYHFVNTDFVCERRPIIAKNPYLETHNDILDYIEDQRAAGAIVDISFYFRDLHNGPAFGVNELADFAPASLMKLPLVLAFFYIDENRAGFLQEKTVYTREHIEAPQLTQSISSQSTLEEGKEYTLEELLRNTIVYSDNDAYYTLVEYANAMPDGSHLVLSAFQELGIIDPRARRGSSERARLCGTLSSFV